MSQLGLVLPPWRPFRYDVSAALREPKWTVKGLFAEEMILMLSGDSSAGKSFVSLALAMAVLDGGTWLGQEVMPGRDHEAETGRVLIVEGEMTSYDVEKRLRGFGLRDEHWDRLVYLDKSQAVALDDREQVGHLLRVKEAFKPDLVIVDSVFSAAAEVDHNNNGAVSAFYREVLRPLTASTSLLLVHHENKPGEHGRGRAEYAATGARAWAHQADRHLSLAAKGDKDVISEGLPDGHKRLTYAIELDAGKTRGVLKPRLDLAIETEEDAAGQVISTEICVLGERQRKHGPSLSDRIVSALQDADGPLARKDLAAINDGKDNGTLDRAMEDGRLARLGHGLYGLAE